MIGKVMFENLEMSLKDYLYFQKMIKSMIRKLKNSLEKSNEKISIYFFYIS